MALTRTAWISSPRQSGSGPSTSDAHLAEEVSTSLIRPSSFAGFSRLPLVRALAAQSPRRSITAFVHPTVSQPGRIQMNRPREFRKRSKRETIRREEQQMTRGQVGILCCLLVASPLRHLGKVKGHTQCKIHLTSSLTRISRLSIILYSFCLLRL